MKISVVGAGYVGLALAVQLSQTTSTYLLDININKLTQINKRHSPIKDKEIARMLPKCNNLYATTNAQEAYQDAEYVIVAVPTDFDTQHNSFNTQIIDSVIEEIINYSPQSTIIIKSTVPIGYTEFVKKRSNHTLIAFMPEFLREGHALSDICNPSRIIIGYDRNNVYLARKLKYFINVLLKSISRKGVKVRHTGCSEAEAIKLFSNAYLALRVAFFNELDTYAEINRLSTGEIVSGICLDPRIGNQYNNPSFGYGGYCLPKDAKQLKSNFHGIQENIISAIIESNRTRKTFIIMQVYKMALKNTRGIKQRTPVIGVYRLLAKRNVDNFRDAAIFDIMTGLNARGLQVIIYEPEASINMDIPYQITDNIDYFKSFSDVIIANRYDPILNDCRSKVYTRDLGTAD